MLAEEELTQQRDIQEALAWVKDKARSYHWRIEIRPEQIEERRSDYYTFIMMPVEMPDLETGDFLDALSKIERKWNNREPRPEKLLFLYPAGVPQYAV